MIIVECAQGSEEWHQERAGVITASMFAAVRKRVGGLDDRQAALVRMVREEGIDLKEAAKAAGYKSAPSSDKVMRALDGETVGDYSDAAKNYAFRLAVERISWTPLAEGFETWAMRRGHELEPIARALHAKRIAREIQQTGLVLTDDRRFGASADGLIGEDGGSEYKCFIDPEKLRTILLDADTSDLRDQVQGCMWLTGRKWWHACLYCPALEPAGKDLVIHEERRDDNYIEAMERDLYAFDELVEGYRKRIMAAETVHREAA